MINIVGLEILRTFEQSDADAFACIVLGGLTISIVMLTTTILRKDTLNIGRSHWITAILITLCSILIYTFLPHEIKYKTVYEVIISDEMSYNEFTEKYEIIEQHDEVYIIQEKEVKK